jgi:DNA (cytosine-5)-methyltransferase 1
MLTPKFFVLENVPGILKDSAWKCLENGIDSIASKYRIVGPFTVNAAHFGAATSRSRVIVIGYGSNEVNPLEEIDFGCGPDAEPATVGAVIGDSVSPGDGTTDETGYDWLPYRHYSSLSAYASRSRELPRGNFGWEVAIDYLKRGQASGFLPTRHTEAVIRRFEGTEAGSTERVSRYPRLDWNSQCATLRAGTGPERGSFQAARPIHPIEPRVITIREAARLQGFPDWFVFHPTIWHSFRMIGNSVSPIVSHALLRIIAENTDMRSAKMAAA